IALPSLSARMNSMRAFGNVVPLAQAWNSAVEARSMRLLSSIGVISTRAAVVPPALDAVAERGWSTSWLKDSISIQSLCSASLDSPLMVSMLRNACCMVWFPFVPFFREMSPAVAGMSCCLVATTALQGLRPVRLTAGRWLLLHAGGQFGHQPQ